MLDIPNQIGIAPFFHGDLQIEQRLNTETGFSIAKQPADWTKDICLFHLPEHLRKKWWDLAAKQLHSKLKRDQNFSSFIDEFKAFAYFKTIPILPEHKFDVIVRPPGEACRGGRVEAFTFGTRLTRITRHLRHRRADMAIAHVSHAVPDWSGGTRIADALAEFSRRWSRRLSPSSASGWRCCTRSSVR